MVFFFLFSNYLRPFLKFSKNPTFGVFFWILSIFPSFARKKGGNRVPRFSLFFDYEFICIFYKANKVDLYPIHVLVSNLDHKTLNFKPWILKSLQKSFLLFMNHGAHWYDCFYKNMNFLYTKIQILKLFPDVLIQNICPPSWALFQTVYSLW